MQYCLLLVRTTNTLGKHITQHLLIQYLLLLVRTSNMYKKGFVYFNALFYATTDIYIAVTLCKYKFSNNAYF